MNDQPKSSYDKFNWWLRNNKITASLIIFGAIVVSLSTFSDAAINLLDLFKSEKRPEINGEWSAEVTYDWANAIYMETFVFEGEGEELYGTASFLKSKQVILEGKVNKNRIEFKTKTNEISGSWDGSEMRETYHHYLGTIENGDIKFVMQTYGGYSTHSPIEFTAQKTNR